MQQRYGHLDWLKIFAMYAVVVIHTIGHFVLDFHNSPRWFLANILSMAARFAVPAFVMCSGALFLRKEILTGEDLWAFYRKYIPHYLGYVIASLVIAKAFQLYWIPGTPLFEGLFYKFYSGMGTVAWYFFMFLGLLLASPFLRQIARVRAMAWAFVGLCGFYTILAPMLATRMKLFTMYVDNMLFPSFFVCYYMLGYLLDTRDTQVSNRTLAITAGLGLLCASVASYVTNLGLPAFDEFYYFGSNPFILIYTISIFLLCKNNTTKPSGPIVAAMSRATPIMYILHNFVLMKVKAVLAVQSLMHNFLLVVPVTAAISWILAVGYAQLKPRMLDWCRRIRSVQIAGM